jgi:hypothetical protein
MYVGSTVLCKRSFSFVVEPERGNVDICGEFWLKKLTPNTVSNIPYFKVNVPDSNL